MTDNPGQLIHSPEEAGDGWVRVSDTAMRRDHWVIAKLRTGGRLVFRAWKDGEQYPAFHDPSLAEVVAFVDRKEGRA